MDSIKPATLTETNPKSIFQSRTFWGAAFTAIAAVAPVIGQAVEQNKFTVDHTVKIVVILATTGLTVTGRVQANSAVYTPDWAPGPNQSDFEQSKS